MSSILSHLLAHHLGQNAQVPEALSFIEGVLRSERAVERAVAEEGPDGPVVHRWHLRLQSLIAPSLPSAVRTAGFALVYQTLSASPTSLTLHAKSALSPALNVVSSPKTNDTELWLAALKLMELVFERSVRHPEWARENVGAQVVQKAVNGLIAVVNGDFPEIRLPAITTATSLLSVFPTALRPLNPALHALSIALLCDDGRSYAEREAGSALFGSLYLLAPKGAQGLKESWKMGVEALVGSVDGLVRLVTADVFAEDPTMNHALAPLELPPLASNSPMVALSRLEELSSALLYLLRTPISDRAGFVPVPIGALSELGIRLTGLARDTPVKERQDPATVELVSTLLPRLQTVGCHILAQSALAVQCAVVPHANDMLSTIARTLLTYPVRSPMRPVLSTTYSLIVQAIGGSMEPDEGRKSLARVWRSVLEDIGSVALEPILPSASVSNEVKQGGGRKGKRARAFDPAELDLQARRVYLDAEDLYIATRALATLERLLRAPAYYFLPPKLVLATSRLLLALTLDPAFFAVPISGPHQRGVDLARASPEFRRGIVRALAAAVEAGVSEGLLDRAVGVWDRCLVDNDEEVRQLALRAMRTVSTIIHPVLPPLPTPDPAAKLRSERVGGSVGDEISVQEGAKEFALKVEEDRDEDSSDEEEKGEERMQVEEEVVQVEPVVPVSTFQSTSFASTGFGSGVSSFISATSVVAPAVKDKEEDTAEDEEDSSDEELPVPVAAPVVVKKVVTVAEEDSSDEDEAMPTIVMSDGE